MQDVLFFQIAGFNIGMRFTETEWPFLLEKAFREQVIRYNINFLKSSTPKEIDYWVEFVFQDNYETIIQPNLKSYFINFFKDISQKKILSYYHISETQLQIILRTILQRLLVQNRGVLFHASASIVRNKAYIFLGKSGAGKSTSVRLLQAKYYPFADDMLVIKKEKQRYFVYQTPRKEKNAWISKTNNKLTLGKVFFVKQAKVYKIEKIENKEEITKELVEQLLTEKQDMEKQLKNIFELVAKFDEFYNLYFSLDEPKQFINLVERV